MRHGRLKNVAQNLCYRLVKQWKPQSENNAPFIVHHVSHRTAWYGDFQIGPMFQLEITS